jgi:NAD(P)-dependent dehydrogenase (short-subunit alcohol dehydrogenase family)
MGDPTNLAGQRVVVVGAGSNTGRQLAVTAAKAGADVVLAGPNQERLEATAAQISGGATLAHVDLADEDSIAKLTGTVGTFDHLVSTAAMHANGPVGGLELAAVRRAFDSKVIGPLLLAKHLATQIGAGGSLTFFSGVAAWRPAPGLSVMATTNGALAFLVEALAVELAPVRVNSISPGIVDTGSWDGMAGKEAFLADTAAKNPARPGGGEQDEPAADDGGAAGQEQGAVDPPPDPLRIRDVSPRAVSEDDPHYPYASNSGIPPDQRVAGRSS